MFWLRWLPSLSVIQTAPGSGAGMAAWAAPAMLPEAISAIRAAAVIRRAVVCAGRFRGAAFMVFPPGKWPWVLPQGRLRSCYRQTANFLDDSLSSLRLG